MANPDERAFFDAVNMTPAALEHWLKGEKSRQVGLTREGEHESIGHQSGTLIVGILRKKRAALDEDDHAHMAKVVSYVKRHSAQRPAGDVEHSRWRYSLMNWGHDPLKP